MPGKTNQYTDAIVNIAEEYRELLKKAPAKKAPQIRSPRNGMDMVEQMMSDQNLSLEEFRRP